MEFLRQMSISVFQSLKTCNDILFSQKQNPVTVILQIWQGYTKIYTEAAHFKVEQYTLKKYRKSVNIYADTNNLWYPVLIRFWYTFVGSLRLSNFQNKSNADKISRVFSEEKRKELWRRETGRVGGLIGACVRSLSELCGYGDGPKDREGNWKRIGYFYCSCGGNPSKREKGVWQLDKPHTSMLQHPGEANPLSVAFFWWGYGLYAGWEGGSRRLTQCRKPFIISHK